MTCTVNHNPDGQSRSGSSFKEAGLTHVPVVIRDVAPDSEEAVGLLVKDNLLRRQLSDMQVARLIRVLKEQYGVKRGGYRKSEMEKIDGSKRQNVVLKIADVVGMTDFPFFLPPAR